MSNISNLISFSMNGIVTIGTIIYMHNIVDNYLLFYKNYILYTIIIML